MTYAELAKERDDIKIENETLRAIMDKMLERCKSLEKEINRLKAENVKRLSCDFVKTAQKKAVKEFAEKLKEICVRKRMYINIDDESEEEYYFNGAVTINEIDELLKQYGVEVEE